MPNSSRSRAPITLGSISSVTIYGRDATIKLEANRPKTATKFPPPIRRPNSTRKMSRKSRRGLTLTIRNTPGYTHFLTLSYGAAAPTDDKKVKKHLDAICIWLTRRGVSLTWRQDWTATGHVHFHLLLTKSVDASLLRNKWLQITGLPSHYVFPVHLSEIRDLESASKYIVKPPASQSNIVPASYRNMGRFWGARGKDKPRVEATFTGTAQEIAPLTRVLRKLALGSPLNAKSWSPRSKTAIFWELGGKRIAVDLDRYWNFLKGGQSSPA
jgi:hypothetical protein